MKIELYYKRQTLIPLVDFKAVLGIDDREDKLAQFCLVTATYTIDQYCKRRILGKTF
jgi:chemotaxis signal transduction protein